jgi:hypothetical protein
MNWLVDADVTEPLIVSQVQVASSTNDVQSVITIQGQPYRVHTWTTDGDITFSTGGKIEVLCVGGGGAGGSVPTSGSIGSFGSYASGGGGGGGGVVESSIIVTNDLYSAIVGDGGTQSLQASTSRFGKQFAPIEDVVTALGGGRGGTVSTISPYVADAQTGGVASGGGGSALSGGTLGDHISDGGDRFFGQGNVGADAVASSLIGSSDPMSGGGGGASQAGQSALNAPPNGGNGVISLITGTPVFYGGGGAGGLQESSVVPRLIGVEPSIGGLGGGGGRGSRVNPNGVNGLGGGGAGGLIGQTSFGLTKPSPAGNGGSGVVIIRYPIGV